MASVAPPKAAPELNLTLRAPEAPAQPGPAAEAAQKRIAEHAATLRAEVLPDKLLVRLDESAGRFVQVLSDSQTSEMLRRYPSEQQLAYARAVMAYMRAISGA